MKSKKDSFSKIKQVLKKSKVVSIVTHMNPDGDAIGSSLALALILRKNGIKAEVIVPNAFPAFLNWMKGTKGIINFEKNPAKAKSVLNKSDLVFILDFNNMKRIEGLGDYISSLSTPKFLIDHHQQPEAFPSYYFFDVKACSTCELVYDLIKGCGYRSKLDKDIAACLYTGLMTDTGSFRFSSVSSKTHMILADLLSTKLDQSQIHSNVYDTYSRNRMKLLGQALNNMVVLPNEKVAYISLSAKELKKYQYEKGDTEGMVNVPFQINGIVFCALFVESDGYVKISFRSKGKIDVNQFARNYFNGGGHVNAAGGRSYSSLKDTVASFVKLSPKAI
ncbi:MAG: bifunctional oligoribonuclease/PAP phosphatase NrnA [Bacteroidia bacterium]